MLLERPVVLFPHSMKLARSCLPEFILASPITLRKRTILHIHVKNSYSSATLSNPPCCSKKDTSALSSRSKPLRDLSLSITFWNSSSLWKEIPSDIAPSGDHSRSVTVGLYAKALAELDAWRQCPYSS